ncbi:MAG: hypothetical protein SFU84_16635 [Gemmatimonadales bacterium]|nr:hypothetical protein [Gemmatimonadales bacterium]
MMRGMAFAGALLLTTSCAEQPEPVAIVPTASAELPRVELVHLAGIDAGYVDARIHKIAVDTTGRIAFFPREDGIPLIRFVDASGRWTGGASRIGPGPGELDFPSRIWFVADTLITHDAARAVEIRFDRRGALLGERRIPPGRVPLAAASEGVLTFDPNWEFSQGPARLWLLPWDVADVREVLGAAQPQLAAALAKQPGPAITYPWPVVAMQNGVIALVEPRKPTVWYFNLAGKLLDSVVVEGAARSRGPYEAAEELENFARASRSGTIGPDGKRYRGPDIDSVKRLFAADRPPVAFIHGANFDGHGRLWIVGPHNDSTRALVLAGTRLLGAIMLPCFRVGRFVSVSNRWLALHCSKGEGGDPPFELQLYRIGEPDSTKLP